MLKELTVTNFQRHQNLTVKFTKGLNVIIGESGIGKSSLVRALFLLLKNQPRNAEAIFCHKKTKKPLEIQIKDDKNNVIKRTKKKYYFNNKLLKAFGTDIPEPISELFPLNNLNWQKQFDTHFLILQTGGSAAKILNSSTGMEDQELLMKEAKTNINEHKSNIKRLNKNNQEHQTIIDKLKPVTRLYLNAQAIKNRKIKTQELQQNINQLKVFIDNLNKYKINPHIFIQINQLLNLIELIETLQIKQNKIKFQINELKKIIITLQELNHHSKKAKTYNMLDQSISLIILKSNEKKEIISNTNSLSVIIQSIQKTRNDFKFYNQNVKHMQKKFNEQLYELGQCPLCGTTFKEGHIC